MQRSSQEPYQTSPFTRCSSGPSGQVLQMDTSGLQGISPCTELVGGGRPRSTGHPLSLARVMVMMEGGMKVDGFFLPHRASALSRLLELSTQATPCDITGHPPLHPASDRKCFQESRSMGSLDPSFIHSPMYSFIHSFTHLSTH